MKRKSTSALLTAAILSTLAATSQAVVYVETGDAGQTPATAQAIALAFNGQATGLTGITGNISTSTDADLYSFTLSIATRLNFSASSAAGIDTSIFLFSSNGTPLIANDDQSGTNFQGGFTTSLLAAGTYYFGISLSGNEAVNSANQLLFTVDQPTTNVRGPASGVNPTILANFNGNTFVAETGAYSVAISAVPEPSTTVMALAGVAATFGLVRRLRRQQNA